MAEEAVKRKLVPRVGGETIRILLLSHDLKPWRKKMWVVTDLVDDYIGKMERRCIGSVRTASRSARTSDLFEREASHTACRRAGQTGGAGTRGTARGVDYPGMAKPYLNLIGALLGLARTIPGLGQSLVSYRTTPQVLTSSTAQVLLEVGVSGSPTRVVLEAAWQADLVLDLRDDGTGGDKVAGDGIYSVQFSSAAQLASTVAADVFRVLIGFVNVFRGQNVGGAGVHHG